MCRSSGECINETLVCDGDRDCPLGDDEYTDDESFAENGPCNAKNNCNFNGKRMIIEFRIRIKIKSLLFNR